MPREQVGCCKVRPAPGNGVHKLLLRGCTSVLQNASSPRCRGPRPSVPALPRRPHRNRPHRGVAWCAPPRRAARTATRSPACARRAPPTPTPATPPQVRAQLLPRSHAARATTRGRSSRLRPPPATSPSPAQPHAARCPQTCASAPQQQRGDDAHCAVCAALSRPIPGWWTPQGAVGTPTARASPRRCSRSSCSSPTGPGTPSTRSSRPWRSE